MGADTRIEWDRSERWTGEDVRRHLDALGVVLGRRVRWASIDLAGNLNLCTSRIEAEWSGAPIDLRPRDLPAHGERGEG